MGHRPRVAPLNNLDFGSAQMVVRLDAYVVGNDEPVYAAGSDHRRDGQAVGW
jgi:gamma-glutamyltranspeptidase/glutathione hydrolase